MSTPTGIGGHGQNGAPQGHSAAAPSGQVVSARQLPPPPPMPGVAMQGQAAQPQYPPHQAPYSQAQPQPRAPIQAPHSAQIGQAAPAAMARPGMMIGEPVGGQKRNRRLLSRSAPEAPRPDFSRTGKQTAQRSKLLVGVFLLFFVAMSTVAVYRAKQSEAAIAQQIAAQTSGQDSRSVSERIGLTVRWIDTAIALRGTASQTVTNVARGPNVTQVAMLDAAGKVIAAKNGNGSAFRTVSLKNFPQSGIRLTTVLSDAGVANPVIVRRVADAYVATMLAPGSFIGVDKMQGRMALVDPGRNVIDGSGTIARTGIADAYTLETTQLTRLLSASGGPAIIDAPSGKVSASNVPNTDLTLLNATSVTAVKLPNNLLFFLLLFASTAAILLTLLRSALRHIAEVHESQRNADVSKERFRVAIEGGRGGVWEIDLKNNAVYLSSSLSEVLGLKREDQSLAVSQFLALFHAGDRERLLSAARRAHMQGEFDMEVRVAHLPLVLQCRGQTSARGGEQGDMVIVGVALDVTEQRGAQTRLQLAEARLYDALNSMTDSFVVWDKLGRLLLWNGKFEDFFGFQPGQLQIGLDSHVVEHHGNAAIEEVYDSADADGQIEIKLKDGRWIRYSESTTADGGQVSIGTDITEIRLREDELRDNDMALRNTVDVLKKSQTRIMELAENYEQEKIRAEDASQSKSDFLANMSHELRTPLNAINGFSDIMKKEMFGPLGDPRYKEYVSDILFSGQHLLSLINDILDMSKIEAGKMTLNTDLLQINDMIAQVVRIVRGRAEDGRLKLSYDDIEVREIEADPRAVKQVLLNLITNAIKFTPEGGTVRIEAIEKQSGIIVKVHDSGIGISKEDIDRLAKPFEQIESKHSKQHEGTGLGLALSKSLIELHGGNFLMESEPGQGTVVTFTLPNVPPVQKAEPDTNEVSNEITRLAQDIADVLDKSDTANPVSDSRPQQVSAQQNSAA